MATIALLHTNDLHGHLTSWQGWEGELKGKRIGGFDRLAGAVARTRSQAGENVLLLDAGDLIGDTMLADLTRGESLITALNHLKYDALTFGNHEPDFGTAVLRERMAQADFPFVAANLVYRKSASLFAAPYVIRKVAGISVGIRGLTYPKTPWTTAEENVTELEFQDPLPAVTRYLPELRDAGAEIVILLSHLGLGGDQRLAEAVPGIDVIVGGHSHNRMTKAEQLGETLIVQAGAHGSDLGRLDLDIQNGRVMGHRRTLIPLDHEHVESDASAEQLLIEILAPHRTALEEIVGTAADWLVRAQTLAGQEARKRSEESPVDSLFADILREQFHAHIAFLPGVGYGVAIPPGPITAADLRQLMPHDGKVVTMSLTGDQILEVLEQAVENTFTDDPGVKVGGMIQVSGIRFRYDRALRKGERITQVALPDRAWNSKQRFSVVTNSMLAQGVHSQKSFLRGEAVTHHDSQYELIKKSFQEHSPVHTPPPGRIAAR